MKKAVICMLFCLCAVLIFVFTSTKTIVETDTVRIEQNWLHFAVYDRLEGKVYNLAVRRRKRSEAQIKPSVLVLTDTIRIDSIRKGFQVISNGRVYQITRKKGVF